MSARLYTYGLGILTGLLLALLVTGGADARPATRDAIPAAPMGVVEPDLREWRTWPAPATMPPVAAVPAATAAPRQQPDVPPVAVSKATPEPRQPVRSGRSGQASWFAAPAGTAAAGKALRAFLGAGWRGDRVRVCGPLSVGVCAVRISRA